MEIRHSACWQSKIPDVRPIIRKMKPDMPDDEMMPDGDTPAKKMEKRITGYATMFNVPYDMDGYTEIVRPGAFADTLRESMASGGIDVAAMIQHEGGMHMLGRMSNKTLTLSEDERGLRYECVPPDTMMAMDCIKLIEGGYLYQSSFGFSVRKEAWNFNTDPPLREIIAATLYEVSVVDFPANPATTVDVESMRKQARIQHPAFDSLRRAIKLRFLRPC